MTNDTSNTPQASNGDHDPGDDHLCPDCGERPLAHPCDLNCPGCEAGEFGTIKFIVHEFSPWVGPNKEFDRLVDAVEWQKEMAPGWGIARAKTEIVPVSEVA
jgi:hypothetical protein